MHETRPYQPQLVKYIVTADKRVRELTQQVKAAGDADPVGKAVADRRLAVGMTLAEARAAMGGQAGTLTFEDEGYQDFEFVELKNLGGVTYKTTYFCRFRDGKMIGLDKETETRSNRVRGVQMR